MLKGKDTKSQNPELSRQSKVSVQMSEEQTEDIKTIRVLTFSSAQQDWDEWSQKFLSMAAERGYREIMEDKERPPRESLNIEEKKTDGTYKLSESERNELKRKRKANVRGYRDLQLACKHLAFQLVSISKTTSLPSGCLKTAWENLQEEFEPTEGEDQINLLEIFQQNKLEDVKVNVTKWITSLIRQRVKLQELNHTIDDEYFITHILGGLPKEYASIVNQAKIDRRTSSLSLSELRKRLKEKYRQLMKTNEWTHEEMSLKAQVNQKKPKKIGENTEKTKVLPMKQMI